MFYVCKYPVKYAIRIKPEDSLPKTHQPIILPIGTIFVVDGINCSGLDLKTMVDEEEYLVNIDSQMLQFGFTETNHIPK